MSLLPESQRQAFREILQEAIKKPPTLENKQALCAALSKMFETEITLKDFEVAVLEEAERRNIRL